MFEKRFKTFEDGIKELMQVSHSVVAAVQHSGVDITTEAGVTAALAINVISNRPTGNGVDWGSCVIELSAHGVEYTTGGGLVFGWERFPEWDYGMNPDRRENLYRFFVQHPSGDAAPVNSTLRAAALAAGWDETCSPVDEPVIRYNTEVK